MTKILYIITRLDRGGSAEAVMQWAAAFKQKGWDSKIITGKTAEPQEDFSVYSRRTGVPIILIEPLHRELEPKNDFKALFKLIALIMKEKPDIVHTNSSKAGILGRLAAWLNRVPVIVHSPHGHIFYGYYGKAKTLVFIWLERLSAMITDRVITLTKLGMQDHIDLKIAKPEKFVPIYCGIDLKRYSEPSRSKDVIRREIGLPEDKFIIGWVGRLVDIKGCEYFIKAASLLKDDYKLHFLIVGGGPNEDNLHKLAEKLEIQDRITFTGHREDIPDMFAVMDIYILSSLNEGLGRTILEAQAAGAPVIASNVGGVPEIVENDYTGILTPPKNSQVLAQTISLLAQDDEFRRKLRTEAFRKLEKFTLQKTIGDLDDLYQELLSKT
ncbi:glycosyltransferase family 4 protein [bacterium]|nr:glycosyltransferase family 4 protein [bacterium]